MTTARNPAAPAIKTKGALYRVSVKQDTNGGNYLAIAEITLVGNRKWEVTVIRIPEKKIPEVLQAIDEVISLLPQPLNKNPDWMRSISYYQKRAQTGNGFTLR